MPKYYGNNWGKDTEISLQNLTPIQKYEQEHWREAFTGTLIIPQEIKDAEIKSKNKRRSSSKYKFKKI